MKIKILQTFTDKYTQEQYEEGEVKDFNAKRAKELLDDPRELVEEVKASKETAEK